MACAYVALGANLGNAAAQVRDAMTALAALPQTRLLARSSLYLSAPVNATGPDYVNAVVALETGLNPFALLQALQALEQLAGRERPYANAPRRLDLDLLLHGDQTIDTAELSLPHPRMGARAFVLQPLAEIAPERVSAQALAAVAGQAIVKLPDDRASGAESGSDAG